MRKGKCQKVCITSELLISMKQKTDAEVSHWPWYEEYHKNKDIHYHIPINMPKLQRWKSAKEQPKSKHKINVHFSEKPFGYIATFRYICKSNKDALHNGNHPELRYIGSLRTKAYMKPHKTKTMPPGSLVNLSVDFHQKEQKYLLRRSRPNTLHLQMFPSTFLKTDSGQTLACKL